MIRAGARGRIGGLAWSALFGILVLASPASAAVTLVQDVFVQSPAGTNETVKAATFASNITAGNVLIATITGSTGASLTSLTGGGVTWTQAVTVQVPSAQRLWIYYGANSSGSSKTVTLEGTAGRWTMQVAEWAGLDNYGTLDAAASMTGTNSFPVSGDVTTTAAGDLLIAVESDLTNLSAGLIVGYGFTALAGGAQTTPGQALYTNQNHSPAYRISPGITSTLTPADWVTGAARNQWQLSSSSTYAAAIAAFKVDASESTYQGRGGVLSTQSANPSCSLPSGIQANDVGIWHTMSKDNLTHTYPAGWNKVTQVNQTTSVTHSWAWKRFVGGESGNEAVTISGTNLKICRVALYRGIRTSGNPHEAYTSAQGTTASGNQSVDPAAVSINSVGAQIVGLIAMGNDTGLWGTWASTVGLNFNGGATVLDAKSTLGTDGNLAFAYARSTSTGPFPTSVDFGAKNLAVNNEIWATFTIALVPGCPVVSDPSYVVASARSGQASVYWSSSNPVVVLRKAGAAFLESDYPRNATTYSAGATVGTATVIYDGATSAAGSTCTGNGCTDTGLTNGTTYYYMVVAKNVNACYSPGTSINAMPASATPQWSYATPAASMAPVALDPWSDKIVAGANDDKLHGKSAADGTLVFAPFIAGGPIQARPALVPAEYRTPSNAASIAYVTSQDGYLYGVNTTTGAQVWKACLNPATTCDPLAGMLQGAPAVWLQFLAPLTFTGGVTSDVVIVATRNTGTSSDLNNKVYAVNGATGAIVWTFAPGNMDIVASTPYLDYSRNTVWVASRSKGGTQSSLWKLNAATGVLASGTSTWSFGDIDSSPIASADGTFLYVGTNAGDLKAVRVVDRDSQLAGTVVSHTPASGAGAVRGMPWWLSWNGVAAAAPDTIVFVRDLTVHSVNFTGTAFSLNWTQTLTWTPSSPIDDAAGNLYLGGSDGKVHRLSVANGTDLAQVPTAAISGTFGEPSINWDRGVIHVGASDGHIYTFAVGF
jgi:hypothetical protein